VRQQPDGIHRYIALRTRHYNDKTARIYTDRGMFTCRGQLGADATHLFNAADRLLETDDYEQLMCPTVAQRVRALITARPNTREPAVRADRWPS